MARSLFNRMKRKKQSNQSPEETEFTTEISKNIDKNLKNMKQMLGGPGDLIEREILIGGIETRAAIIYIKGISDENLINNNILKAIQLNLKQFDTNVLDKIYKEVLAVTDVKKAKTMDDVSFAVLNGNTAFYLDGTDTVLLLGTTGGETRSIEQPDSETLIRGPRDGFVENIVTNMALLRRDIRDPNLRFKTYEAGKRSKQKLVVSYIEGIANPEIVEELNRRLKTVDIDYLTDSASIEQWIEDSFLSPFPQLLTTERPDKVSFDLVQGKVAILVDGTPFTLIAPISIGDAMHSMEDYNQRWFTASLLRLLRFFSAFIAIFLPALYIALVSYHPAMIPSTLAFSIAASREGVPFPGAIEAILMAVTFEILQEAGIRLPRVIGQTIGIVGGLVIGEAAVNAGIVSPIMVIVTALTAIAGFSIPSYSFALTFRALRFGIMLAASIFGLYGIILAYIMISIHIVNLKSVGIPYSTPFAPLFLAEWRDLVIRAPITKLTERPEYLKPEDKKAIDTKQGQRKEQS
ncbi:spore germination protein [Oceanobacillus massiliensis]|uniref:spore germination protein n=1 Tax=Oceanobacillus massiliensis TaxID=1465765 RepID=UPI0002892CBF|nr:spore germination protein [Oceanobacillus massiliensis]